MLRSAAKDAGRYDIAIIGAGSAGCAAALSLLLYSPLRVVVMDRLSAREKPGETVPPSIIGLLEYLNTDESFYRSGHLKTYGSASAWGREKLLTRAIVFDTEGHGWHLDRRVFERSLQDEVRKRGGCLHEASVRSLQRQGNGWSLQVESSGRSTTLKTRFVLDASGRLALFSRKIAARRMIDDRLAAALRFADLDSNQDTIGGGGSLIESVENGWWYSAGLPNDRFVIAYFSDPDLMRIAGCYENQGWRRALEKTVHTRKRMRLANGVSGIQVRAANSHRLLPAHGADWIAAGDAAVAVDPLSSMGIGLALLTGIHSARVAAAACAGAPVSDCGYTREIVRQYEHYLTLRKSYYAQETRWRKSLFWKRRA